MKVSAIILAAGQGKRMNSSVPKQFLLIENKPLLYYSLLAFEQSEANEIILVIQRQDETYIKKQILSLYPFKKVKCLVPGGNERYLSVYEGLKEAEGCDIVLIHDGARPLVDCAMIQRVIDKVKEKQACIAAVMSKDTIKLMRNDQTIDKTLPRTLLWNAQTPQGFSYSCIRQAYDCLLKGNDCIPTDDAMVLEKYSSVPVSIVEGSYDNIKVTTPEDLILAQMIWNRRNKK